MKSRLVKWGIVCASICILILLYLYWISPSQAKRDAGPPKTYTIRWSRGPDAPVGTMEGPCIQVGNKLFVMGGFTRGLQVTRKANMLNLKSREWKPVPPLPQSQTHVGIATDGQYLYLVGGQMGPELSKNIRAEAFRYDMANKVWDEFTSLPEPRAGGALVCWNGYLHYFGGVINDRVTVSNKHWAIPVSGNGGWGEKAPLIDPGDHIAACVLNGKFYAIGGEHGHGISYDQHDAFSEYDPETNTWTRRARLPAASSHFETSVLIVHGRIVVLGGQGDSRKHLADVRIYDPDTNSWSFASPLPNLLKGGAAAFYDDRLYFVSGRAPINGKIENLRDTWIGSVENPWW